MYASKYAYNYKVENPSVETPDSSYSQNSGQYTQKIPPLVSSEVDLLFSQKIM